MNEFTASNGIIVGFIGSSQLWTVDPLESGGEYANFSAAQMQALREFFQAEADERLGRWRWPENPDYVVYGDGEHAVVVSESDPSRSPDRVSRRYLEDPEGFLGWGEFAARAYFDAHPEPKPWHDANPGEVWLLEMGGVDVLVEAGTTGAMLVFWPITGKPGSTSQHTPSEFTAGRRIWPERES